MGALRGWTAAAIASALVLDGCASPDIAERDPLQPRIAADPAPTPPAFRLEVTHVLPLGGGHLTLDVLLVPEGSPPFEGGTPYAEKFTFPEAPLRAAARGRPPEIAERMTTALSPCPGFSLRTQVDIFEVPRGAAVLPDLVILAPIDQVLAFEERRLAFDEGKGGSLLLDPIDIRFSCQRSLVWMSYSRILPGDPMEDPQPWLAAGSRNPRDLLSIEDADGVPLRKQGEGLTSGIIGIDWVSAQSGYDGPIRYPVTVKARVPVRWERTVQRFVLRDIPIPSR